MEKKSTEYLHDDEIDLKELFKTIWERKVFVSIFTLLITFVSIIYVYFKSPVPIYEGSLLVEIAQIKTENNIIPFDNINNIKVILEASNNVIVTLPPKTNRILKIISNASKKEEIKKNIEKAYEKLIEEENKKLKFFEETISSKRLNIININPNQINKPEKKITIIVSFVISFILSIFLVFFIQFIRNFKEEKDD